MQDADLDSVNDGLPEALATLAPEPAPEPSEAPAIETESDRPRDERGRFKTAAEKAEEAAATAKVADPDDDAGGRVPAWRLREIREERDQIAARAEAAERRALEAEQRWQAFQRQQQQYQQPQRPDLISDPEAYADYLESTTRGGVQSVAQTVREQIINLAFDMAADQYGQDVIDAAFETLLKSGDQRAIAEVRESVNPPKVLMAWHKRHRAAQEVGDDLDGFVKRKQEEWLKDPEVRKRLLAEMNAEARGGERSSDNVTSLPSLNRAPGGGGRQQVGDLGSSDQEMFQNLTRKRR